MFIEELIEELPEELFKELVELLEELLGMEERELLVITINDELLEARLDELLLDDNVLENKLLDIELVDTIPHAPKSVHALAQAQPTPGS